MQRKRIRWGRIIISVFIFGCILTFSFLGYIYYQFYTALALAHYNLEDNSPETIFRSRFMDGTPIPLEVTDLYGIEGSTGFGYSNGPAFIRFKAPASVITEILKTDYGRNGTYSLVTCSSFPFEHPLVEKYPEKFEWWKPSEVISPVCYKAYTCTLYDEKFLLVDQANHVVYFYRTPICGLCPSGQEGADLQASEQCR